MKIYIEGTPLFQKRSGIGQYTKRLIDALAAIDSKSQYTVFSLLFAGKRRPESPLEPRQNVGYRFVRFIPGRVYSKLMKARFAPPINLLLGSQADIYLFPNFVAWPLAGKQRIWSVIYDLSYIKASDYADEKNRRFMHKFVGETVERSEKIITISDNSKNELIEYYKISPERITVINPAIDHKEYYPRTDKDTRQVKKKFNINGKYVLYTGTIEPRKNINGIMDAYENLPATLREEYTLVLAVGKGWLDGAIHARLEELKDLDIVLTGYVADEDMPSLYSGASLFVFPSFYEGWGMPPLEAMACGVPVITSNNSSLPEVVGDAGIMVDAHDTDELSKQIARVLTDKKLATEMVKKGLKQAQKFSWEKSAKKLHELIEQVGKQ